MIQAATYTSEAEIIAAYKLRRAKEAERARRAATANQNAPAVKREATAWTPAVVQPTNYQPVAHLAGFKHWQAALRARTPRQFRNHACKAFGLNLDVLLSANRTERVYHVRKTLIEIVHERYPHLSYPEIAKLFNREHTTIVSTLGRKGKGKPPKLKPEDVREIRRRHADGETLVSIQKDFPVDKSTVRSVALRLTWKDVE